MTVHVWWLICNAAVMQCDHVILSVMDCTSWMCEVSNSNSWFLTFTLSSFLRSCLHQTQRQVHTDRQGWHTHLLSHSHSPLALTTNGSSFTWPVPLFVIFPAFLTPLIFCCSFLLYKQEKKKMSPSIYVSYIQITTNQIQITYTRRNKKISPPIDTNTGIVYSTSQKKLPISFFKNGRKNSGFSSSSFRYCLYGRKA